AHRRAEPAHRPASPDQPGVGSHHPVPGAVRRVRRVDPRLLIHRTSSPAISRKPPKPTVSVIRVRKIVEASAGSWPIRFIARGMAVPANPATTRLKTTPRATARPILQIE